MDKINLLLKEIIKFLIYGGKLLNKEIIYSILEAGITGAGLIFVIYTFILPITKSFFKPRVEEYRKSREKYLREYHKYDPIKIIEDVDAFNESINKLRELSRKPRWIDKKIIFAFFGYISSSILSIVIIVFNYHGILDLLLLILFVFSSCIFLKVGISTIREMIKYLTNEYANYIAQIEQIEPIPTEIVEKEEILKLPCTFEEEEVGKIPRGWVIERNDSGRIEVTDKIGADGTKKSLKIHSPENSKDNLSAMIKPYKIFTLTYYLYQAVYGDDRGAGIGLMLHKEDIQAIWMAIWKKKLTGFWEGAYRPICDIELNKWYKIVLHVDCSTFSYICIVNDNVKFDGKFRNNVDEINTLKTPGWFKQAERLGYIDEITIS